VVNSDGVEEVLLAELDAGRKASSPRKAGLSGVIGSMDGSPAGDAVFVAMERADLPAEVFRVDVAAGASARVTRSHHAGINESDLVREELFSVPSSDGRKISVFWYSKKAGAGEKLPVVIQIHGGPESQAQPYFNPITQMLALNGYAVAVPNVRGSTGYGKAFAHLDDKERREDSVRDIHEVGKFLATRPDVDPKKLVLYGGSYGGYMVLAGLTLYPEQWAAGVDIVGIANFRTFLEQTAPYRRALREAEYGSLAKDGALLDRLSPLRRVDRIRAPLMVIHGTRDPRVPIGEARQISEALQKRGQPVELLTFDDEGHGLAKRKNRLVAYPAMLAFLDRYVKGQGSPPGK
jgi:dipeptidyl aminopeptidase/acylaminoacyl peptidase